MGSKTQFSMGGLRYAASLKAYVVQTMIEMRYAILYNTVYGLDEYGEMTILFSLSSFAFKNGIPKALYL